MTFVYFIIMIGVLVAIHEAGHMLVAKAFNMYVREYSIGFGPVIWKKKGKETLYSLRLIPLGGFTGLIESEEENVEKQETGEDEQTQQQELKPVVEESRTFYGAHPLKRIAVLLAGPAANLILAFVVFISLFISIGQEVIYPRAIINEVVTDGPAYKAGVLVGDEITGITYQNGEYVEVDSTDDISINNSLHSGNMILHIVRDGKTIEVSVTPEYNQQEKRSMIGVVFSGDVSYRKLTVGQAIGKGITYTLQSALLTLKSVGLLITGQAALDNLSGTIGIYSYTKEAVSYGLTSYLSLVGSISISLAVMNLLPVPIFDGGRIVLTLIEMIIGKRLDKRVENIILTVGLILVLMLFALTTFLDISKLISK